MPEFFELHIPSTGQLAKSKLRWNSGCEVGISFESLGAFGSTSSSDGELSARMARLEDEIGALKQTLGFFKSWFIKRKQPNLGGRNRHLVALLPRGDAETLEQPSAVPWGRWLLGQRLATWRRSRFDESIRNLKMRARRPRPRNSSSRDTLADLGEAARKLVGIANAR